LSSSVLVPITLYTAYPGTYTVTVTAVSGIVRTTLIITVTVTTSGGGNGGGSHPRYL
jgi:hypothetical protein